MASIESIAQTLTLDFTAAVQAAGEAFSATLTDAQEQLHQAMMAREEAFKTLRNTFDQQIFDLISERYRLEREADKEFCRIVLRIEDQLDALRNRDTEPTILRGHDE